MKLVFKYLFIPFFLFLVFSNSGTSVVKKFKCLIQMKNYSGEGAYIIISLIKPNGDYEKTIYVHGDDSEWYYEMTSWWKFYGKKRPNIDGITGGTISGGERAMSVLKIDASKINSGYKLRFESAVENENYYEKDIEFKLTSSNLKNKFNGKGFIRYIRILELR